ncbi:MAG: HEAT repeat domain-containing protein [Acaryochloridaceae cyanobacterium RU_4_10]|nr:HEAT repeat domain-containing protein [Acaryochloridaceae cyanobacterium RU_4_10]
MDSNPNPDWFILLLCHTVRYDPLPNNRALAAETLIAINKPIAEAIEALTVAMETDPDDSVRTRIIQAIQIHYVPQSIPNMSDTPKVQMTFNAPVYGAAGNIEGNQVINASTQDFDALFADYKQFFADLQQKYSAQPPETDLQPIIDAAFQEIQKTQPQRWQNFLNLKRLWNGGKKATFNIGEHFTEENVWGKMAIAFLEGMSEDV